MTSLSEDFRTIKAALRRCPDFGNTTRFGGIGNHLQSQLLAIPFLDSSRWASTHLTREVKARENTQARGTSIVIHPNTQEEI